MRLGRQTGVCRGLPEKRDSGVPDGGAEPNWSNPGRSRKGRSSEESWLKRQTAKISETMQPRTAIYAACAA